MSMKQPLFPSTFGTQSHFAFFLTVKAVVRKFGKSDGQTVSWCSDKAVPAQWRGGGYSHSGCYWYCHAKATQIKYVQRWSGKSAIMAVDKIGES